MKPFSISNHNIKIMFWIQFFGTINFMQPVLTLFYLSRGLTAVDILFLQLFWSGAVLIGEVPGGIIADRFGPKVSFFVGSLIKILSLGVLIFAYSPWLFFLSSALNGFSATFFSGADEALIYESLKEEDKHHLMDKAMGNIQSAGFISMLIAVIFGAFVAKDLHPQQFIFLICLGLVFYLFECLLIFFIKSPSYVGSFYENSFKQVSSGIKAIRKAPQLLFLFLNYTLVFIPADSVYEAFNQPLFKNAGLPVFLIGIIYAMAAIGGYFFSRNAAWLATRFSRKKLMHLTGILTVLGLLLSAVFQQTLWMIIGAFFLLRFGQATRYPIYSQLSNDLIPSSVRATTISLLSVLDSAADLIVFGVLAIIAVKGLTDILLVSACVALIGMLFPIQRLRQNMIEVQEEKN